MPTVFTKIINKETDTEILYEDDKCLAFRDINPQAPVHILLIPKKEIRSLNQAVSTDQNLLGHLMLKAVETAKAQNLKEGWRLVVNTESQGGQTVFHLHIHIMGGRQMNWPPG